jgi:hypothetical protein
MLTPSNSGTKTAFVRSRRKDFSKINAFGIFQHSVSPAYNSPAINRRIILSQQVRLLLQPPELRAWQRVQQVPLREQVARRLRQLAILHPQLGAQGPLRAQGLAGALQGTLPAQTLRVCLRVTE